MAKSEKRSEITNTLEESSMYKEREKTGNFKTIITTFVKKVAKLINNFKNKSTQLKAFKHRISLRNSVKLKTHKIMIQ